VWVLEKWRKNDEKQGFFIKKQRGTKVLKNL
jgi:hypothetical protein